jgi:hypothetical protein
MPKDKWSNELSTSETVPEQIDREMQRMTPRERHVSSLAEKYKDAQPQLCSITNKNPKAMRVIHDFYGTAISIPPNETKSAELHPGLIDYFKGPKSDLQVVMAA